MLKVGPLKALFGLFGGLFLLQGQAEAFDVTCDSANPDFALVDGALAEWREIGALSLSSRAALRSGDAWEGAKDAALDIQCLSDPENVLFALTIRDDRIVRAKAADAKREDSVFLEFADETGKSSGLRLFPPDGALSVLARWESAGGRREKRPKYEAAGARVAGGYQFEVLIPLAAIPGWTQGAPRLAFAASLFDADSRSSKGHEAIISTGPLASEPAASQSHLNFEAGNEIYSALMRKLKLSAKDIRIDRLVDIDGTAGAERVIAGGKFVGAISDNFSYFALPVAKNEDVLEVRLVELTGDGRSSVVTRFRQQSAFGTREVLAVWNFGAGGWQRTFAHEIGKEFGAQKLSNSWAIEKKSGRGARGAELVFAVGEAVGFTEENFREMPAEDMLPILLPWGTGAKYERYQFAGEEFTGGAVELPVKKGTKAPQKPTKQS